MKYHIVNRIQSQIAALSKQAAMRHKVDGQWMEITWRELGEQLDAISAAMAAMGIAVQDKVAIYANNTPRWTQVDLGTLYNRAVTVPIYPTNTTKQAEYVMQDSAAKLLFVGEQAQLDAAMQFMDNCDALEAVIALTDGLTLPDNDKVLSFDAFLKKGTEAAAKSVAERLESKQMDDLLTLIYTSGTTGQPKGVMLDYQNIASQLEGHDLKLAFNAGERSLCFLPLSHVFERCWTFYVLHRGGINCYLDDVNLLKETMAEVKPQVMCAVPRIYEKIFATIHEKVAKAPFIRKALFTWAVNMGAKMGEVRRAKAKPSFMLAKSHNLADKLVLSKIRAGLGGEIKMMPCGGAKLDPTIGRFFHALGINVKLGYGMTETTATVSCWDDSCFDPDSIGMVMPGAEVRIGENDEILVKGPMVMRGYYNMPEETAKNFTADGFLKTGDCGKIDEYGNVFITDRIKELMKTSGGKYIAPQVIEGAIGKDHFIEQVAVIADTRKFVSALIVPCMDNIEEYARELNIKYHDRLELLKHSDIVEMLEKRVNDLQKDLARFEQVKKFTLLANPFSMDEGELTPTMKLRRKVINERYSMQIEGMYADA
ncbi:AMP-dependent synthetase/ligase [Thaumasiovibrio sp. DFM-14]|uniref:AMP-dependent synthetase/ligase n=1 Tax=Thaumasiovibrio sp. DFM-14 TaxID=3384792 RepID=UPI0039A15FB2